MTAQALDILLQTADEPLLRQALHRAQEVLTDEQRLYILHGVKAQNDSEPGSIFAGKNNKT
jgi:hypothetical protein